MPEVELAVAPPNLFVACRDRAHRRHRVVLDRRLHDNPALLAAAQPRRARHDTRRARAADAPLRELAWREFAYTTAITVLFEKMYSGGEITQSRNLTFSLCLPTYSELFF